MSSFNYLEMSYFPALVTLDTPGSWRGQSDDHIDEWQVVSRIKYTVSFLSEQPGIGRPGRVPNTKELVVDRTPYILPFRVRDNRIEILRVLHAARQWPKGL